jgi:predicted  nucleic acid-binding Zn-ribbon protein
MGFLTNFFNAGGADAVAKLHGALMDAAPDLAGTAQLMTMDQSVDQIGNDIGSLKKDLRAAQAEEDRVHGEYSDLMGAAEVLSNTVAALDSNITAELQKPEGERNNASLTKWNDEKESKTASLNNLLGQIEHMLPTVDKDKARVEKLTQQLHQAEDLFKKRVADMANSGSELKEAKRDAEAAARDEARAKEDAARAARLAGIAAAPDTNSVNSVTEHFRAAAEAAQARAEQLDLKTETLNTVKQGVKGDPNIQAAIATSKGTASSGSLTDRLAALRR